MNEARTLNLRVQKAELISPSLKHVVLESADRSPLPSVGAGSHIRLSLCENNKKFRNAYSIAAAADDRSAYEIIVRRVEPSRGGSAFIHNTINAGQTIEADYPGNLFPPSFTAQKHLLISAGIGITPFLSYLSYLRRTQAEVRLHHFCRVDELETFRRLLQPYSTGEVYLHPNSTKIDVANLLQSHPLGTHLYVCGPEKFMETVLGAAKTLHWPSSKLHSESFGGAHTGGAPFVAVLARSGIEVKVGEDQTLLEAIEAAGVEPPSLCRGGACGQCLTEIIDGRPEHRDHYLSPEEHNAGRAMMICVSRAKGNRITLDL